MSPGREIVIALPAQRSLLGFCRISAAGAASAVGFDLDDLDDVRTAVGEAVGVLLAGSDGPSGASDPDEIVLRIRLHPQAVEIAGTRQHVDLPMAEETELTAALLGATTDDYSFDLHAGRRSFRLVKRRSA